MTTATSGNESLSGLSTTTRTRDTDEARQVRDTGYRTLVGAASLAIGPLVMAVGDLLHPKETADISRQAAIVVEHATRWYLAHLLLLIGLVLFIPGLLMLTDLASARRPRAGYAARLLV